MYYSLILRIYNSRVLCPVCIFRVGGEDGRGLLTPQLYDITVISLNCKRGILQYGHLMVYDDPQSHLVCVCA